MRDVLNMIYSRYNIGKIYIYAIYGLTIYIRFKVLFLLHGRIYLLFLFWTYRLLVGLLKVLTLCWRFRRRSPYEPSNEVRRSELINSIVEHLFRIEVYFISESTVKYQLSIIYSVLFSDTYSINEGVRQQKLTISIITS